MDIIRETEWMNEMLQDSANMMIYGCPRCGRTIKWPVVGYSSPNTVHQCGNVMATMVPYGPMEDDDNVLERK